MNIELFHSGVSLIGSFSHLLESSFQLNLQALLHLPFVLLADASGAQEKVQQAIRPILFIILVISNIWGIIKVIQGAAAVNRGEEGYLQIIGGLLMAAAVWIVYYAFEAMGLSAARIDLKGYGG